MKRKANISIELQASNVTNGMDLPDSDWGDFSCWRAVDSSSLSMISVLSLEILVASVFCHQMLAFRNIGLDDPLLAVQCLISY